MQSRRSAVLNRVWVFAVFVFTASAVSAQTVGVNPRIAGPINSANRVVIRGNVHPYARPQYDRGLVADSLSMTHMLLVLKRSPEQEASLSTLLSQQQNPSSPQYHQWLTPAQFGRLYGPADTDIMAITDWLASQGFTVNAVSPGRTVVDFSGTAGQVRAAFGTQIHRYVVNGQEHWANASDPQIPAALAPVVAGINSLHNFPLRPLHRVIGTFSKSRTTGEVKPLTPSFTFPGCGASCNALGPNDFAAIYNVLPLWNAGIDGTGQVIAIAQNTNINVQDVHSFRNVFGLPANDPRVIVNGVDPGITDPGAESEADLDVQWAGAVAKNAAIDLVVSASGASDGVTLSAQYIIDNNFAAIMSVSFGQCELFLGVTGNQQISQLWQQAAAEGITVLVAAGDQGSATCDALNAAFAVTGLAVNGLASTPYNVAVGGTSFNDIVNPSLYWNSANTSTTQASAKGYIPETTWNDSCTNAQLVLFGFSADGETNCNDPKAQQDGLLTVTGGGGGVSNCIAPTGASPTNCAGAYPKPVWQAGAGVPNDAARDVPDVSLFSGGRLGTTFYVVCQADLDPGGASCNLNSPFLDFQAIIGTSASTPAFAGMMAMVDQKTGSRQGNANPALYNLAAGLGASCASAAAPAGSCIFYDVTLGTNAMPCLRGSPACTVSGSADTYGVLTGYAAAANYDLASGLGSVNAANLANSWPSSGSNSGAAGFSLESSSVTIAIPAIGQSSSATLTVTGFGGFSGTVNLACSVSPVLGTEAPTCAFSPSAVALDSATTSAATTLQISSTAPQTSSVIFESDRSRPAFLGVIAGLICLASFFFVSEPRKRRTATLLAVVSIILLGASAGCSGGGNSPASTTTVTNIGTPAGNYVVTVTATSGNLKQATNVFVTIP
jgi:subtilase family serine protease